MVFVIKCFHLHRKIVAGRCCGIGCFVRLHVCSIEQIQYGFK